MKKGILVSIMIVLLMVGSIVAASCTTTAPSTTPTTPTTPTPTETKPTKTWDMTFTMQHPVEQRGQRSIHQMWIRMIEAKTNGAIKITFAGSSTLAAPPDNLDAVKTGMAEMGCQMLLFTPGRMPLNEVIQLPLLFKYPGSRALSLTSWALINKYPELEQEWSRENVKILGVHANGPSHCATINKPIKTMEDLDGVVMIAAGAIASQTAAALGATPEGLGPTEMYDALAKGVCDGIFLEWEGLQTWHLAEVLNYATECGLWVSGMFDFINMDVWNSLPPEYQELIATHQRASEFMSYDFDLKDIDDRVILEDQFKRTGYPPIYVMPDSERERWVNTVMPIREDWVKNIVDKGIVSEDRARAILADAVKFAEQYSFENYPCDDCESTPKEWATYPRSSAGY